MLDRLRPSLPLVGKVGNYHGGFGKARLDDEAGWVDFKDLVFLTEGYIASTHCATRPIPARSG